MIIFARLHKDDDGLVLACVLGAIGKTGQPEKRHLQWRRQKYEKQR